MLCYVGRIVAVDCFSMFPNGRCINSQSVFTLAMFGAVRTNSGGVALFVQLTWISVNAAMLTSMCTKHVH